ncbi:MAG: HD domain-containing protein [Thermoanaerobaculia bacterium]|nr:HD domain-containing protein [Thermoanaerobaculia bacterium]
MKFWDSLYGPIEIPDWTAPLLSTPEVQRLRDIRLINTASPSCLSLSDTRRLAHVVGVTALATLVGDRLPQHLDRRDRRHFVAAALLHDIGTPPFGHLFEYLLEVVLGWNHEHFVRDILRGTYRPEKRYHQVYFGAQLRLFRVLQQMGLDVDTVADLVRGEGNAGALISGWLDLDNVDNVFRMSQMLGLGHNGTAARDFALQVCLGETGKPLLTDSVARIVSDWSAARSAVYEVLAFEPLTLASQCVLTDALTRALGEQLLGPEHWYLTDDQLLLFLSKLGPTRQLVRRFALGDLYRWLGTMVLRYPADGSDLRRPELRQRLTEVASSVLQATCSSYVFRDHGTFSKQLLFDGPDGTEVATGETSRSVIVALFDTTKKKEAKLTPRRAWAVLDGIALSAESMSRLLLPASDGSIGQAELPF